MRLISHRGNITGPNHKQENKPDYIKAALEKNFDVEIDVWCLKKDQIYLGHDYPEIKIDLFFLKNNRLWCHAKNLSALQIMLDNNIRCFWHQEDDYTITSDKIIWTYPNNLVCEKSVIVCLGQQEAERYLNANIYGICSDFVGLL